MRNITSKEEHDKVVSESPKRVVVDYYGEFCNPCKAIEPVLNKINEDNDGVEIVKVDAMSVQDLSHEFGIKSVPTFVVFENGEKIDHFSGTQDVERILKGL